MKSQTRWTIALLALTMALAGYAAEPETLTVFLVRHGEQLEHGKDSKLAPEGIERAARLAEVLRDDNIEHVHSTDYFRTRDTAAPLGLPLELYDPRDLPALAEKLRSNGGTHLVVGHSNTTPALVGLLGGEPGPEIDVDVIIKATKVDGVYSADPMIDPDAVRFSRLSFDDVIQQHLGVMDMTAITLCQENNKPIIVLDMWEPDSLVRAMFGEDVGTLIA